MAVLTRPELPAGAGRDLVDALHELHHRAGWPSLRSLAREVGCSPTTVSAVFSSARLPTWGSWSSWSRRWTATSRCSASCGARLASRSRLRRTRRRLAGGSTPGARRLRRHLGGRGGRLLLVTGEAGIGKTRLVSAAQGLADDGVRGIGLLPPAVDRGPAPSGRRAARGRLRARPGAGAQGGVRRVRAVRPGSDRSPPARGRGAAGVGTDSRGRLGAAASVRGAPGHAHRTRNAAPVRGGDRGPALGGLRDPRPPRLPPRVAGSASGSRVVGSFRTRGPGDGTGDRGVAAARQGSPVGRPPRARAADS